MSVCVRRLVPCDHCPAVQRIIHTGSWSSTNGSSMPQHAAPCCSARFWELLVGVLKHAAACQNFHMADFFFHTMSNL